MIWKKHSEVLKDTHSILSPSRISWINYSPEKMRETFLAQLAVQKGVELHDAANRLIKLKIPQKENNNTFNMFVNDAIALNMETEQLLFYSINAYGTADAISFYDNHLRIHDLKTGKTLAKMEQLDIYSALFCLEYEHSPYEIEMTNSIYQSNEILRWHPIPENIRNIMDIIIIHDRVIEDIKSEVL